jgi:hypothetical protein
MKIYSATSVYDPSYYRVLQTSRAAAPANNETSGKIVDSEGSNGRDTFWEYFFLQDIDITAKVEEGFRIKIWLDKNRGTMN